VCVVVVWVEDVKQNSPWWRKRKAGGRRSNIGGSFFVEEIKGLVEVAQERSESLDLVIYERIGNDDRKV
jgi:hypothetical protein